jgi:hypothetical protein
MGGGSRAGKLHMHSKVAPSVDTSRCISCGLCVKNCAVDGIKLETEGAKINSNCIGCAKCISVCPEGAVMIPWSGNTSEEAQKRCAEYALGAVKGKDVVYLTFINNITKDCDCFHDTEIIGPDIGIVAGRDPVALDQACYDLVRKETGRDIFKERNSVDGTLILPYAEEIGLGKREYELVEV